MVNYNMDHVIRQNVDYLNRVVEYPHDIFIFDQSSNDKYRFKPNAEDNVIQMDVNTNIYGVLGHNTCIQMANNYALWNKIDEYFAYLVCVTSGLMDPNGNRTDDIFTPCIKFMEENEDAVMVQPAYHKNSNAMNVHLKNQGTGKLRQVQQLEYTCAVFRGDWFREIGYFTNGILVHGQDLWLSYLARLEEKTMWVHDGYDLYRDQDNGYNNDRVPETRDERTKKAMETLAPFGQAMLGSNWWHRMWYDHSTDPNWKSPQA